MMHQFWYQIESEINQGNKVMLMYVLESIGSSPGRQGFKMLVSSSGLIYGSIGGGMMEHKLVELCRDCLIKHPEHPFMKRQVHQADSAADRSGMICSGEQTIAFYFLDNKSFRMITSIVHSSDPEDVLVVNEIGISLEKRARLQSQYLLDLSNKQRWSLVEKINFRPFLNILGGGHVSLALSKFASQVGFSVTVFDDRKNLNTVERNDSAHFVFVPDYEKILDYIDPGQNRYFVIMSFGYRSDKILLQQLLTCDFKYLGMIGSQRKVDQLFAEMQSEGIPKLKLEQVHTPIGLPIFSKTPEEIAISILAEMICVKNTS
jgi:xanthine dehydrogenase accessory factor